MLISAKYKVKDYKALKFDSEDDWLKAVDILKDRIEHRFLEPAGEIMELPWSGFAIMALDCLLIETLQQFRKGVCETERGKGREYFTEFLTETSFGEYFNQDMAEKFYRHVRNGILHQAETKENTKIRAFGELVCPTKDLNGLIVNRNKFHKRLVKEFHKYLDDLRKGEDDLLRENFRRKMDYICRMGQYEPQVKDKIIYFAYGSNMSKERLKERGIEFEKYGIGYIKNMGFRLNKKSIDGSAKANIEKSEGERVWGVLYRINSQSKELLDEIEHNYHTETVDVNLSESCSVKALTYVSDYTTEDQRATREYKEIIVQGAVENNLPDHYVKFLKKIPTK